jgi:hypothetical protein
MSIEQWRVIDMTVLALLALLCFMGVSYLWILLAIVYVRWRSVSSGVPLNHWTRQLSSSLVTYALICATALAALWLLQPLLK